MRERRPFLSACCGAPVLVLAALAVSRATGTAASAPAPCVRGGCAAPLDFEIETGVAFQRREERRLRPPRREWRWEGLWWLVPLVGAAVAYSVSEILCDVCIGADGAGGAPHLTGVQTAALAGAVMLPSAALLHASLPAGVGLGSAGPLLTAAAVCSGLAQGAAALLLLQAYEAAPSTVILPLTQLTAVVTFGLSAAAASLRGVCPELLGRAAAVHTSPSHLAGYMLILVAGTLPLLGGGGGGRRRVLRPVLLSNVLTALSYELMALCTTGKGAMPPAAYHVVVTYTNAALLLALFIGIGRLRGELRGIRRVPAPFLLGGVAAEALNWLASWLAVYAYGGPVSAGVVNAAEMTINQAMNLGLVLLLKRFLGAGRDSAAQGLHSKLSSCIVVAIGVVLAC